VTYDGGKNSPGVIHAIAREMPPHQVRVELFGGSFPTLRLVKPAALNIGLDLDVRACSAATSHPALRACEIHHGCALSWMRSVFPIQYEFAGTETPRTASLDAVKLGGRNYQARDVLVYADPPYLITTRSCQRDLYRHELKSEEEHAELLDLLTGLPCLVMLSGYRSALYDRTLADWRRVDFQGMTRRGPRVESLWCNFPAPAVLHDASFAGLNHRERWNLTKRKRSWTRKLQAMTAHERQAIREALAGVDAGNGGAS
jgi:DNA adenine methylase